MSVITLQEINISHLGKRKIIFKYASSGDMLIPWRVTLQIHRYSKFYWIVEVREFFGDASRTLMSMAILHQLSNGTGSISHVHPVFYKLKWHPFGDRIDLSSVQDVLYINWSPQNNHGHMLPTSCWKASSWENKKKTVFNSNPNNFFFCQNNSQTWLGGPPIVMHHHLESESISSKNVQSQPRI